jgi:hypothetical protein
MSANYPTTPESFLGQGQFPPQYEVVRHLVSFLRWRFSKLPTGAYHWADDEAGAADEKHSEVFIAAENPIPLVKAGQRPAISVRRGPLVTQGNGLGNLLHVDAPTGRQIRMDLMPTNLIVAVISRVDIEAERLGFFCFEQIFAMREQLVASLPCLLNIGGNMVLNPPGPAGTLIDPVSSEAKWMAVELVVPTFLQHATTITPLNKSFLTGIGVNPQTR